MPCSLREEGHRAARPAARIQLVSATLVLGLVVLDCSLLVSSSHASLGVLYSSCFMGVSLISLTIASSSAWVRSSNGVFLGRYRRILPFLFSLVPRCQEL